MLPQEFLERMENMLGEEYPAFLKSYDIARYQALRLNPQKGDDVSFLNRGVFSLERVPWAEHGYYYTAKDTPGKHPYHEAGVYYIQEPSAMAPAAYLTRQMEDGAGERILDLCAAPGGKSTQIAAAMEGRGTLISNEIHPARAKILSENIERMGIRNAVVTNEDSGRLTKYFPAFFDGIIVDAPCSGEGMFRKDETAVTEWSPENVRRCAGRQQEILENAAMMLKPGGRLVYSTCTFAPEEDEQAIGRFLEAHPEFALEETPDYPGLSHGVPAWGAGVTDGIEKTVRIWPHRTEGEGHYAALLRKTGEPESVKRKYPASMKDKKLLAVYEDFCKEIFIEPKKWTADSTMTMFGDQLYRTPEEMVDFKGLRVLRPGLQMGEFKKNRFEPSHALALALHPSEVKQNVNLSADAPETAAYLRGETIQLSEEDAGKGWCLVSVDGYSLGWGKKSGGTLKNHYPKGLRKQY